MHICTHSIKIEFKHTQTHCKRYGVCKTRENLIEFYDFLDDFKKFSNERHKNMNVNIEKAKIAFKSDKNKIYKLKKEEVIAIQLWTSF